MELFRRMVWFALAGTLSVFVVLVILGQVIQRQASRPDVIVLRDEFSAGVHKITGIVPVSHSCAELSVRSEQTADKTYRLLFETWREPSVECREEETPRWVQTVVFTDGGPARFIASIDGTSMPISVYPYAARRNATTTLPKPPRGS